MNSEILALLDSGCLIIRVASREKRPLGSGWQHKATDNHDTVASWLRSGSNIGILLGPMSGVVDVEYDTPEGREQLSDFGLLDSPTPTWRSSRGEHRLFHWEPWMPETAVVHAESLEVRIGGRAAQSVLPPSIHPDGVAYEWVVSPADCPIAAFPAQLLAKEVLL
jgi:hypothetical protein